MLQYDIPIVLFSAFPDVVLEHHRRSMGIRSVVSKSAPIEVLLKEVQKFVPTARSASA
jgi:hypothetical protein